MCVESHVCGSHVCVGRSMSEKSCVRGKPCMGMPYVCVGSRVWESHRCVRYAIRGAVVRVERHIRARRRCVGEAIGGNARCVRKATCVGSHAWESHVCVGSSVDTPCVAPYMRGGRHMRGKSRVELICVGAPSLVQSSVFSIWVGTPYVGKPCVCGKYYVGRSYARGTSVW